MLHLRLANSRLSCSAVQVLSQATVKLQLFSILKLKYFCFQNVPAWLFRHSVSLRVVRFFKSCKRVLVITLLMLFVWQLIGLVSRLKNTLWYIGLSNRLFLAHVKTVFNDFIVFLFFLYLVIYLIHITWTHRCFLSGVCAVLSALKAPSKTSQRLPHPLTCPSTSSSRGPCCRNAAVVWARSRVERLRKTTCGPKQ